MLPDHDGLHAFTIAIMPRETPLERPQAEHPDRMTMTRPAEDAEPRLDAPILPRVKAAFE
jgi:hypothetical protein